MLQSNFKDTNNRAGQVSHPSPTVQHYESLCVCSIQAGHVGRSLGLSEGLGQWTEQGNPPPIETGGFNQSWEPTEPGALDAKSDLWWAGRWGNTTGFA